jgi:glycosyltransferase involved in cell wall biosynthesis
MQVRFFFRKPSPAFHSIEKLFFTIHKFFPEGLAHIHHAPFESTGFLNRLKIGMDARKNQGQINHITGDIHFIAMFLNPKKTVLTVHDIGSMKQGHWVKKKVIRFFWFYLPLKFVRKITVISEFTKMELLERFSINPEDIVVIPNCYSEIYTFKGIKEFGEKPVILQIGTKVNKNLENLIESLAGIDCKLLVVGKLTSTQLSLLENNKMDYENYFHISEEEMLQLYYRSDILAYVSTYEGFGVPVLEANAVGRPVLASAIEPIKSVAGDAAFFVDPCQTADIRKGILKLIEDGALRESLVYKGLANAKRFHPSLVVQKYLQVYKSILEGA